MENVSQINYNYGAQNTLFCEWEFVDNIENVIPLEEFSSATFQYPPKDNKNWDTTST